MLMRPILGAAIGLAVAGIARADEPRSVGASHLFAPLGYDDNDEIVVVADGYLPSTCYQLTNPKVTTDAATHTVTIDLKAHTNSGSCVNVPVPFEQEIDLGSLPAGDWTISTTVSPLHAVLKVAIAPNANPDEYLYAPIDSVAVAFDASLGRWTAELTGDILASCLSFQETRVLNQGPVLVVMPILTQDSDDCRPTSEHFSQKVLLPQNLEAGRHMLHVRSLNGRAVNRLFDVRG